MRKVTWRHFNQSAKQLVVGQTTMWNYCRHWQLLPMNVSCTTDLPVSITAIIVNQFSLFGQVARICRCYLQHHPSVADVRSVMHTLCLEQLANTSAISQMLNHFKSHLKTRLFAYVLCNLATTCASYLCLVLNTVRAINVLCVYVRHHLQDTLADWLPSSLFTLATVSTVIVSTRQMTTTMRMVWRELLVALVGMIHKHLLTTTTTTWHQVWQALPSVSNSLLSFHSQFPVNL